jgi:NADPH-dependent 2,4-dienoyl-CoA reductase/sulfur reductase-like enzyme/rhodanese-related sulfurtransferase
MPLEQIKKVLIVGGVAGGATAAARLRRLDENIEIILFERDEYISFANCGLPYYIGGEITSKQALTLQTPQSFNKRFNVDVRCQHEVVSIARVSQTVSVKNRQSGQTYIENYDTLILAPGAESLRPPQYQSDKIFTLRNIPDTFRIRDFIDKNQPKSAVVVGGGYIGLEIAENLHRQGITVTIIQRSNHVLATLDFEMGCDVHRHILNQGVDLRLNTEVSSVTEQENGLLSVKTTDGTELSAAMMILAIGVKPDTKLAKDAGLKLNQRDAIIVSETMLTSDPNIYAVGDAVEITNFVTGQKGYIPLAGPANKQARIVADNICGIDSKYNGTQGSSVIRVFEMTVATTGLNEASAKAASLPYDKVYLWQPNHAGYYPGSVNMSMKILFDKTNGKILGAEIVGYDGVDKRCDVLATAIRAGMTGYDLAKLELCYAPPFASAKDPVNMAGFVIENVLTEKVKMFHWHDVADLQKRGGITLLDVRTPIEYDNGHIDGFVNIQLDELRKRFGEIDKNKPVYLTCQVGQRGYLAARILMNLGFDVYNLSGGYRLYHSIFGTLPKVQSVDAHSVGAGTRR